MTGITLSMSRSEWIASIGSFMVSMGEIERMIFTISLSVLGEHNNDYWMRKSLDLRISTLQYYLPKNDIGDVLNSLIAKAKCLITSRNILAHGVFTAQDESSSEENYYIFWQLPSDKLVITLSSMLDAEKRCLQLSEELSLWLSSGGIIELKESLN